MTLNYPNSQSNTSLLNVILYKVTESSKIIINNASNNPSTSNRIKTNSLSFGTVYPTETSPTFILFIQAPNAVAISNIKIGLTNSGGITPVTDGIFGVENRNYIDDSVIPSSYFQGISDSSLSANNIAIPNSNNISSYYIYLNFTPPSVISVSGGVIRYRVYFDYA